MEPRDPRLVEVALGTRFTGYSRRTGRLPAPFVDRIVACVVLLGTMVLSGIVLGSTGQKGLELGPHRGCS